MRLFFALWPEPATQREWYHATGPTLDALGGRRLPPENLHLTLHFLGETVTDRLGELSRLGADVAREAVSLRFDKIECWGKADLACLRAGDDNPALTRLVGNLGTGLQMAGFPVESRRFKPHVTVARKLRHREPALPLWPVLEWRAESLALVRSRLGPEGSEYDLMAHWPLPPR